LDRPRMAHGGFYGWPKRLKPLPEDETSAG
jgi:hypothetical protein